MEGWRLGGVCGVCARTRKGHSRWYSKGCSYDGAGMPASVRPEPLRSAPPLPPTHTPALPSPASPSSHVRSFRASGTTSLSWHSRSGCRPAGWRARTQRSHPTWARWAGGRAYLCRGREGGGGSTRKGRGGGRAYATSGGAGVTPCAAGGGGGGYTVYNVCIGGSLHSLQRLHRGEFTQFTTSACMRACLAPPTPSAPRRPRRPQVFDVSRQWQPQQLQA